MSKVVWTDDVRKMTLGNWMKKWFNSRDDKELEKNCSYAPLFERLVGEVIDGKAFMLYCNPAEAFYLADKGVKSVISVDKKSDADCLSNLINKYNKELTLSCGKSDKVDLSANLVCAESINPMTPSFMDNFVAQNGPYEVFAVDCRELSNSHLKFVLEYARDTVADGKYLLLKNIGDRVSDIGPYWNKIEHANTFMNDDYSVLLRKDSKYASVLHNKIMKLCGE